MGITDVRKALKKSTNSSRATWTPRTSQISRIAPETAIGALAGVQTDSTMDQLTAQMASASSQLQDMIESLAGVEPPAKRFNWQDPSSLQSGKPVVSLPKDQSPGGNSCNSCVAFAVCSAVEARMNIQAGQQANDVNLSEAYLFFAGCPNNCCSEGWSIPEALAFCQSFGIPAEEVMHYDPQQTTVPAEVMPVARLTRWSKIANATEIKRIIAAKGPVLAAMSLYDDLRFYGEGIYQHVTGDSLGQHAVCIIGYDDAGDDVPGHWICKNSWGTDWGEDGFFRIAYGDSGIGTQHLFFDFDLQLTLTLSEAKAALDKILSTAGTLRPFAQALFLFFAQGTVLFQSSTQVQLAVMIVDILTLYPSLRPDFVTQLGQVVSRGGHVEGQIT